MGKAAAEWTGEAVKRLDADYPVDGRSFMARRHKTGKMNPRTKTVIFWILLALLSLGLLESLLHLCLCLTRKNRIGFQPQPVNSGAPDVDRRNYQMIDPAHPGNWVLIPGYHITVQEILDKTEKLTDRREGDNRLCYDRNFIKIENRKAENLRNFLKKYHYSPRHYFLQINRFGFKGPEFSPHKTPGTLRIMTIGDSCTFGWLEDLSYPRVMERTLRQDGIEAQVINAGVQGYAPDNVLLRLPYFLSFKPEVATIYLGWNAIPGDEAREENFLLFDTLQNFLHLVGRRQKEEPNYYRKIANYHYRPDFMPRMEKIVREIKAQHIQPVLLTLPALFSPRQTPDPDTFGLAHHLYQGNLYLFAEKVADYNQALRELASREQIPLIDLEKWEAQNLVPPAEYFADAVHLNDAGNEKLGIYLAGELEKLPLPGVRKPTPKLQAPRS